MTIVLATYRGKDNLIADIQQDKYQTSYTLDICQPYGDGSGRAHSVYRNTYTTKKNARQAMNRFSDTWTRER